MNSPIVNEYLNIICGFLLYLRFKFNVFLHFSFVFQALSNVFGYRISCYQIKFCLFGQGKMKEGQGNVREMSGNFI